MINETGIECQKCGNYNCKYVCLNCNKKNITKAKSSSQKEIEGLRIENIELHGAVKDIPFMLIEIKELKRLIGVNIPNGVIELKKQLSLATQTERERILKIIDNCGNRRNQTSDILYQEKFKKELKQQINSKEER